MGVRAEQVDYKNALGRAFLKNVVLNVVQAVGVVRDVEFATNFASNNSLKSGQVGLGFGAGMSVGQSPIAPFYFTHESNPLLIIKILVLLGERMQ